MTMLLILKVKVDRVVGIVQRHFYSPDAIHTINLGLIGVG